MTTSIRIAVLGRILGALGLRRLWTIPWAGCPLSQGDPTPEPGHRWKVLGLPVGKSPPGSL